MVDLFPYKCLGKVQKQQGEAVSSACRSPHFNKGRHIVILLGMVTSRTVEKIFGGGFITASFITARFLGFVHSYKALGTLINPGPGASQRGPDVCSAAPHTEAALKVTRWVKRSVL